MSSPAASPAQSSDTKTQSSGFLRILRNYRFPLFILTGVVVGAIIGLVFGERATVIKPFGTLFINMMFTLVVPLVFFSISSAVAGMSSAARLGKIMGSMLGVFAVTGIIAFVGLIVPHAFRMLVGPGHRLLIPASTIGGAVVLLAADIGARTLVANADLPLGMLTSIVGGPFFFWLLYRTRRTQGGWA